MLLEAQHDVGIGFKAPVSESEIWAEPIPWCLRSWLAGRGLVKNF